MTYSIAVSECQGARVKGQVTVDNGQLTVFLHAVILSEAEGVAKNLYKRNEINQHNY